jgi:hypothetical protein
VRERPPVGAKREPKRKIGRDDFGTTKEIPGESPAKKGFETREEQRLRDGLVGFVGSWARGVVGSSASLPCAIDCWLRACRVVVCLLRCIGADLGVL